MIFFKSFNLPPQVQQQLNETVSKKAIKQPIIQPTPPEIIPNVVPKTEDFFVDDDEFDSFKKPEPMAINIGQPKDMNYNDLVMISDDDEAKISKSLIKTGIEIKNKNNLKWKKNKNRKPYKKPITKQNLQDALDTRLDNLNDLETVDYNNDLIPIKNLKQLKKKMMMKKLDYRL